MPAPPTNLENNVWWEEARDTLDSLSELIDENEALSEEDADALLRFCDTVRQVLWHSNPHEPDAVTRFLDRLWVVAGDAAEGQGRRDRKPNRATGDLPGTITAYALMIAAQVVGASAGARQAVQENFHNDPEALSADDQARFVAIRKWFEDPRRPRPALPGFFDEALLRDVVQALADLAHSVPASAPRDAFLEALGAATDLERDGLTPGQNLHLRCVGLTVLGLWHGFENGMNFALITYDHAMWTRYFPELAP